MWNDTETPLAYLITFRTYGTWLHGDARGSIDCVHNRYRDPYLPPSERWQYHNLKQLKTEPFVLGATARRSVEKAIRETCVIRKWHLQALNVRTNHVHAVVIANCRAGQVLNALKQTPRGSSEKIRCGRTSLVRGPTKAARCRCGLNVAL